VMNAIDRRRKKRLMMPPSHFCVVGNDVLFVVCRQSLESGPRTGMRHRS
jgi:hypothetical protein